MLFNVASLERNKKNIKEKRDSNLQNIKKSLKHDNMIIFNDILEEITDHRC